MLWDQTGETGTPNSNAWIVFFAQFCFVVSVEIITDNSGTVTNIYTVMLGTMFS